MTAPIDKLEGVVISDEEWQEYATQLATKPVGTRIYTKFGGDSGRTWIWRRDASSNDLVCIPWSLQKMVPLLKYSEAITPTSEAHSESAKCMQQLVIGGVPSSKAITITQMLYARRDHSEPIDNTLLQRIIEQNRA
jgi:hypothetical protein